jgi:hypothetical protein
MADRGALTFEEEFYAVHSLVERTKRRTVDVQTRHYATAWQ